MAAQRQCSYGVVMGTKKMKLIKYLAMGALLFSVASKTQAQENFNPKFDFAFAYGAVKALDKTTAPLIANPGQAVEKYCGRKSTAAATWTNTVTGSFYVTLSQTMMQLAISGETALGTDASFIRDLAKAVDARGRIYIDGGLNHLPREDINKRIIVIDQRIADIFAAANSKLSSLPSREMMLKTGEKAIASLNIDAEFKKTCDVMPMFEAMEK